MVLKKTEKLLINFKEVLFLRKEYLQPEIEIVKFTLTDDILSISQPPTEDPLATGGVEVGGEEDPGIRG